MDSVKRFAATSHALLSSSVPHGRKTVTYIGALPVLARRLVIVGGFALAIAAPISIVGATAADPPVYVAQCNGGEEADAFTTTCVPFMTPNTHRTSATAAGAGTCPPGVSGTECGGPSASTEATNPEASEAEQKATETEQIGEDVAGADNT
jgi:hypothetical protein